jgi:hypothetical protein
MSVNISTPGISGDTTDYELSETEAADLITHQRNLVAFSIAFQAQYLGACSEHRTEMGTRLTGILQSFYKAQSPATVRMSLGDPCDGVVCPPGLVCKDGLCQLPGGGGELNND